MECFLKRLENVDSNFNPSVKRSDEASRLFEGLILKKGELSLDKSFFNCCSGSGTAFIPADEKDKKPEYGTGNVLRCNLTKKFSKISSLFEQHKNLFSDKEMKSLGVEQLDFLNGWASSFKRGEKFGQAIQIDNPINSVMWPIAFFFAWHKGFNPKIVYLEKNMDNEIFDGIEKHDMVLLDGIHKLWEPSEQLKIDRLINFCYGAEVPLWVFFPKIKVSSSKGSTRNLRAFEKKLYALKSQNPMSFLSDSAKGKLEDICLGLERIPK